MHYLYEFLKEIATLGNAHQHQATDIHQEYDIQVWFSLKCRNNHRRLETQFIQETAT